MRLCVAAALLATAGLSTQAVWAAELGTLSVSSRLNEPLAAKLTVNDVTEASQPLVLRLASEAVYTRVGRTPLPADLGVKLSLASRSPWIVNVTSSKSVTTNDIPLIIEMSEAGKLSAKFYRVKLEPAKTSSTPTTSAKTSYAALPSVQKPAVKPMAALPSAQTPSKVESAAAKIVNKTESAVPKTTVAAKTPSKVAATSAKAKTSPDDLYNLSDLSKPVTVKAGMTMWSIAKMYQPRYEGATPEEVLVGLVRNNPKAFTGGKVTGVKLGSRLRPPSQDLVQSIGRDTAWCLVHVTPGADATKSPLQTNLAKAQARLDKMGVSYVKPPLDNLGNLDKVASEVKEPASVASPVPQPSPQPEAAATAPQKPVEEPVAPPPVVEAAKEALPLQPKAQEPKLTVTTTSNIRTEELPQTGDAGNRGWLWGVLVLLAAGAGGWFFWRRRKNAEFEKTARAVRFRTPEPTTDEQMKGVTDMVKNRLSADAAARRGFPARTQVSGDFKTAAPSSSSSFSLPASAQVERSNTVACPSSEASPAGVVTEAPATSAADPARAFEAVTPTITNFAFAAESAHATTELAPEAELKPFTLRSTAEGTTFEVAGNEDSAAQKLEVARRKISDGLPDEAAELLREVSLTGTPEQKMSALSLLDAVKRV